MVFLVLLVGGLEGGHCGCLGKLPVLISIAELYQMVDVPGVVKELAAINSCGFFAAFPLIFRDKILAPSCPLWQLFLGACLAFGSLSHTQGW